MIFVVGTTCICFVPSRLDEKQDNSKDEERVIQIPYKDFFKDVKVVMSILAYSYSPILIVYLDPILSLRMKELGSNENEVSLAFALMGLTYCFGSIVAGLIADT